MSIKKYSDVAGLSNEALEKDLKAAEHELNKLRHEHKVKGLQNPMQIRHLRKEIAQMNTEWTKRTSSKS